jgi:hypothetical protein
MKGIVPISVILAQRTEKGVVPAPLQPSGPSGSNGEKNNV